MALEFMRQQKKARSHNSIAPNGRMLVKKMAATTVRRIEIRALFPLNLRQFALTDFKKPHKVKKLEKKTKRMALVPS